MTFRLMALMVVSFPFMVLVGIRKRSPRIVYGLWKDLCRSAAQQELESHERV